MNNNEGLDKIVQEELIQNCGSAATGNYKDPSTGACTGKYAYNDKTCDRKCQNIEAGYFSITT